MNFRFLILLFCTGFLPSGTNAQNTEPAKRVIFVVGDGMGLSQWSVLPYYSSDSILKQFTTVGLMQVSSSSHKITDSAAGATAFSTGTKTYNGAIGVGPDTTPVKNITEILVERGFHWGFAVTSPVTHATPAAFYAHVPSRTMNAEIALSLPELQPEFFAGSGLEHFSVRTDSVNLINTLVSKGYRLSTKRKWNDPATIHGNDVSMKRGYIWSKGDMPTAVEGRSGFLSHMTDTALAVLSPFERFFLLVEGSQIDWAGHRKDTAYLIAEMLAFEQTLKRILNFAKADGNTLVVVLADHETGGFSLNTNGKDYDAAVPTFSTRRHTATLIPVMAYGPGSELFGGYYQNSDVFTKLLDALNIKSR